MTHSQKKPINTDWRGRPTWRWERSGCTCSRRGCRGWTARGTPRSCPALSESTETPLAPSGGASICSPRALRSRRPMHRSAPAGWMSPSSLLLWLLLLVLLLRLVLRVVLLRLVRVVQGQPLGLGGRCKWAQAAGRRAWRRCGRDTAGSRKGSRAL